MKIPSSCVLTRVPLLRRTAKVRLSCPASCGIAEGNFEQHLKMFGLVDRGDRCKGSVEVPRPQNLHNFQFSNPRN